MRNEWGQFLGREQNKHSRTFYATNSYGIGSTSSGSFPLVLTKCPLRGAAGSRLQITFSPFSRASLFFLSFSFTRWRKSSRQREWCTCSMRTLMRLGMIRFLEKEMNQTIIFTKFGLGSWLFLPNLLVEDDTHSSLGHIEHTPSLAVVKLVRHTLLKCTITLHTYTNQNQFSARSTCECYSALPYTAYNHPFMHEIRWTFPK